MSLILGLEWDLATLFYDALKLKYYWRDWGVVVYPEKIGSDEHWRSSCYVDDTTWRLNHWKGRYNILISSISGETADQVFTTNDACCDGLSYATSSAKDLYEMYFKGRTSKTYPSCKYPIKGMVKTSLSTFAFKAKSKRFFHKALFKPGALGSSVTYFHAFVFG